MKITLANLKEAQDRGRWTEIDRQDGRKPAEQVFREIEQVTVGGVLRDWGNANRVLHSFPEGLKEEYNF